MQNLSVNRESISLALARRSLIQALPFDFSKSSAEVASKNAPALIAMSSGFCDIDLDLSDFSEALGNQHIMVKKDIQSIWNSPSSESSVDRVRSH